MNRVADNDVEPVEYREYENHGKSRHADAHNRNPCYDIDEVVAFLREKITLCYE